MNYNDLAAQVPVILRAQNSSLTNADNFLFIVREAQEQVINLLDHEAFKVTLSGQTIGTDGVLDLTVVSPTVLEVRSIEPRIDAEMAYPTRVLKPRSIEALAALYPSGGTGVPVYYAEIAHLTYVVFPRPAAEITCEVRVNQKPSALSVGAATNVLTERYPRVLDNAVLRRAALFMKDYAAVEQYTGELTTAVSEVNAEIGRHRRDESSQRPRPTENVTGQ